MQFEMLLSHITTVPNKFLIVESDDPKVIKQELESFDKEIAELKTPTILLERLKKEFDEILKSNP